MTSTEPAKFSEIMFAVALVFVQIILSFVADPRFASLAFVVQNLFLIQFIVRRFLKFRKVPFAGFLFLPLAFVMGLLGAILSQDPKVPSGLVFLFSGEAFVCNLVVGLGSRLVPVISRIPGALSPIERTKREVWMEPIAVALLLNFGYLLQGFLSSDVGILIKTVALIYAAIRLMGLFRRPSTWSVMGLGLKVSILLLILGQLVSWAMGPQGLAALHLTYIGGLVSLTFLISMRVTLAHGDQPLSYEIDSKRLVLMTSLFMLSAITRFLAGPNPISSLVTASVMLFSGATVVWAWKFVRVLIHLRSTHGIV